MKNKKILLITLLSFLGIGLLIYFTINIFNPKEYSIHSEHAIIRKIQRPNKNPAPDFFSINIISIPNKEDLKGIEKEYTLPKIEADQDYIKSFLEKKYNKDEYNIDFSEDGSFKYENKSIKEEELNLSESDAIKLGKKLLDEIGILNDDAIVYNIQAEVKKNEVIIFYNSQFGISLDNVRNKTTGYYSMDLTRSINNVPIIGTPKLVISFNTNGIHSINYNWDEVKIIKKGNFISDDIIMENFLKDVVYTVDVGLFVRSCFKEFRENEGYCLSYDISMFWSDLPPTYIDVSNGECMYHGHLDGTVFDGGNRY